MRASPPKHAETPGWLRARRSPARIRSSGPGSTREGNSRGGRSPFCRAAAPPSASGWPSGTPPWPARNRASAGRAPELPCRAPRRTGSREIAQARHLRRHVEGVGKVEIATPATSAPISRDSPIQPARPATLKHQASAPTCSTSGTCATTRNTCGSTYRLTSSAAGSKPPLAGGTPPAGRVWILQVRLDAEKRIANKSCSTRMPSVMRPGRVSSSRLS